MSKQVFFYLNFFIGTRKGRNPEWVYKTIKEVEQETALSRHEQDIAIKMCKRKKVIEVDLKGIPAKRYFKLNLENIISLLENETLDKE